MLLNSAIVRNTLWVASAVAMLGWFYLLYLVSTSPSEANIATGHTIPSSEHGRVVYITPLMHFCRFYVAPIFFLLLIAASAAEGRRRATPNTSLERTRGK